MLVVWIDFMGLCTFSTIVLTETIYKEKVYTLGLDRKAEEDVWSFSWVKEAAK